MGAAALLEMLGVVLTLIIAVAPVSIIFLGSEGLPTGSEFFSIFPVAFGGIGGGNTSLFAFLLPVLCVSLRVHFVS